MHSTAHGVQQHCGRAQRVVRPVVTYQLEQKRTGKNATHCCIWVNHGVDLSLALLARRSNHFRPPTLELPRLRTLGCDGRPSFELVERQLLHQLCPRIGRRFELLDQVFAISIVMEHLEVM